MENLNQTTKCWATPIEVADYLSVSKKTIYRLVSDKELVAAKIRGSLRIKVDSLRRYERKQVQLFDLDN